MKKQILFLSMFTLALIFAGTTNAFGQTTDLDRLDNIPVYCPPALPLLCGSPNGLNPMPGEEYEYTISSSSVGTLHWFVTDDNAIITTQGTIAATIEPKDGTSPYILSADPALNDATNTSPTVKIRWKPFDGTTNQVILVVYNVDDKNCTDNMEVYRIEPQYSFTLDIAGIADDGIDGGPDVKDCVNPIQNATYNGTDLTVDYGTDYVFFAVNAANWQTSWMPDNFSVTTDGGSAVSVTGWAYPDDAINPGGWKTVGTDQVEATKYTNSNGFVEEGCIIVRVEVVHGTATENIADEVINLTVNGEMLDPQTVTYSGKYPDLDEGGQDNACITDLTTDNANYTITPRPTITETIPTPFENKIP